MPKEELKHLPTEVKVLVNDGVYALYSVRNLPGVAFVLVTSGREIFPISTAGDVVPGVNIRSLDDVEVGSPARFTGLEPRASMKLNYAY